MTKQEILRLTIEEMNAILTDMNKNQLEDIALTLEIKEQIVGFWKMTKLQRVQSIFSIWESIRVINEPVNEEVKKGNKTKKAIKITFIDGTTKEYESIALATKELELRHHNAIGSYWIKGKSVKAINNAGIKEIVYI